MKLYELADGVYLDSRVGNYWMIQEAWSLYIIRWIERAYENDL